jgi:hypothetical protein
VIVSANASPLHKKPLMSVSLSPASQPPSAGMCVMLLISCVSLNYSAFL